MCIQYISDYIVYYKALHNQEFMYTAWWQIKDKLCNCVNAVGYFNAWILLERSITANQYNLVHFYLIIKHFPPKWEGCYHPVPWRLAKYFDVYKLYKSYVMAFAVTWSQLNWAPERDFVGECYTALSLTFIKTPAEIISLKSMLFILQYSSQDLYLCQAVMLFWWLMLTKTLPNQFMLLFFVNYFYVIVMYIQCNQKLSDSSYSLTMSMHIITLTIMEVAYNLHESLQETSPLTPRWILQYAFLYQE